MCDFECKELGELVLSLGFCHLLFLFSTQKNRKANELVVFGRVAEGEKEGRGG